MKVASYTEMLLKPNCVGCTLPCQMVQQDHYSEQQPLFRYIGIHEMLSEPYVVTEQQAVFLCSDCMVSCNTFVQQCTVWHQW